MDTGLLSNTMTTSATVEYITITHIPSYHQHCPGSDKHRRVTWGHNSHMTCWCGCVLTIAGHTGHPVTSIIVSDLRHHQASLTVD